MFVTISVLACDQISYEFPRGRHLFMRRISYITPGVITYALSLPVLLSRKWRAKCVTDENRDRVEMPVTLLCYSCPTYINRGIVSPNKSNYIKMNIFTTTHNLFNNKRICTDHALLREIIEMKKAVKPWKTALCFCTFQDSD